MTNEERRSLWLPLAKHLHAAYTAHHLGISLAYAAKRYGAEDPGEYWLDLAEMVDRQMRERVDGLLARVLSEPKTVQ